MAGTKVCHKFLSCLRFILFIFVFFPTREAFHLGPRVDTLIHDLFYTCYYFDAWEITLL